MEIKKYGICSKVLDFLRKGTLMKRVKRIAGTSIFLFLLANLNLFIWAQKKMQIDLYRHVSQAQLMVEDFLILLLLSLLGFWIFLLLCKRGNVCERERLPIFVLGLLGAAVCLYPFLKTVVSLLLLMSPFGFVAFSYWILCIISNKTGRTFSETR